jgi:serine/threonine-protein phosphatase 5
VERSDDVTKYDDKEIDVPASYDGPKLESVDDITPEWIKGLMEYQAKEKRLHKKYVVMLINEATKLFAK